jgi:V/A-type H+-transporting ATPase subunit C
MSDKKITDRDYLFVSAMLKAREAAMLDRDKLEQMLSAAGFDESAKLLAEGGWPDMTGQSSAGVDALLSRRREELFNELERVVPEKQTVGLFRLKYDYHNAKAIVKGEGAGVSAEHILSRAGQVSPEKLLSAFQEDDFRFVPGALGGAMAEAKGLLARTDNPQAADFLLDKAYFAELLRLAGEIESSAFPAAYVRTLIDGANLRTCVRCQRMGKDPEFLQGALIPGGGVSYAQAARGTVTQEELAGLYESTPFRQAAALGAEAMEGGPMTEFERACDNAVNSFLDAARRSGFGAEVVIGYLAAEENNITAVRMVLTGLLSGLSPQRLRERLRDTYV